MLLTEDLVLSIGGEKPALNKKAYSYKILVISFNRLRFGLLQPLEVVYRLQGDQRRNHIRG